MTDDLVKRLELLATCTDYHRAELEEAVERIKQLEKGFCDIIALDDAMLMSVIARACLTGAIDAQGKYCYVPYSVLGEKKDD